LNIDIKKCEQGRKNKTTRPQPSEVMPITRWKFGTKRYNLCWHNYSNKNIEGSLESKSAFNCIPTIISEKRDLFDQIYLSFKHPLKRKIGESTLWCKQF
jgi:hypothetical protein